jgi:hypothetical protein
MTTNQHPHHDQPTRVGPTTSARHRRLGMIAVVAAAGALTLAACGSSSSTTSPTTNAPTATATGGSTPATGSAPAAGGQILPVTSNPISNTATAQTLTIDSVLVENNVDSTGAATDDHLEIALSNTGTTELGGFEVFYTFDDPTASISESYYAKLPDTFTIAPGATRIAHFDNSGAPDHFPVNDFSLYKTSANALDVTVVVSATDAAPQTATVMKDAGGAETAD